LNGTNSFTGTNTFSGPTIATNAGNIFNGAFTGNGGGLTNLATGGITTNVLVAGVTFYITNGIIMNVQ
jgi:hypothetical protein